MMRCRIAALASMAALSLSAHAADLYVLGAPTGPFESPSTTYALFNSGAGTASFDLTIQGYATLDGDNAWIDILRLELDGTLLVTGTWDLGGGGIDRVLDNPVGATVVKSATNWTLRLTGSTPVAAGSHTLSIDYSSPISFEGSSRAGAQGLSDEGFGVKALTITGPAPVPEPGSLPLWLAGLGVVAGLVRPALRARG